jgi:hypothetical protein
MAIRKSSNSGIPFGNTASRPASPAVGQPYFNGEVQRLELYTGAQYGWQNIVAETPGVTGYTGTISETSGGTITITGTNFASGATTTLIGSDGTEYIADTTTVNNLTSITAIFNTGIDATKEPYDIRVTNPSNLYGVYYDVLTVNDKPIWQTASGSLGTITSGLSFSSTVSATDEENNTITYSSPNLPAWLSINSSSGVISGTAPGVVNATTYSFTINASDGINAAQSRSFSVTVNPLTVSGGTLTSDTTYYYRVFTSSGTLTSNGSLSADVLVIAGGGSGGHAIANTSGDAGGGGAGGVRSASVTINSGTNSIVVGNGGAAIAVNPPSNSTKGNRGENSSALGITSTGGGGGGADNGASDYPGQSGGSGGGGSNGAVGGSGNQGGYNPPEGYSGGNANPNTAGGGGGAGGVGNSGSNTTTGGTAGTGGPGTNSYSSWLSAISSIMPANWQSATSSGYIAGGGGGGADAEHPQPAAGGSGGGGAGGARINAGYGTANGTSGIDYTGSGGGATGTLDNVGGYSSGAGGKGLVVVRYTKASVGG